MLETGQLVKHKSISVLARVVEPDPDDDRKVMIKMLGDDKVWSCEINKLEPQGKPGR